MSRKSSACSFDTFSLMFDILHSPTMMPITCSPNSARMMRVNSSTPSGSSFTAMRITSCRMAATVELRPSPISRATISATAAS